MKLVLKNIEEVAKWRKTSFKTKITNEEILGYEQKYGIDNLYIHFDSGVPRSTRGAGYDPYSQSQEPVDYSTDPDAVDKSLDDDTSTELVPQKSFNPQTRFKTPVGIYLYQLKYAREVLRIKDFGNADEIKKFPFAAEGQFIYVYHIKPENILNIEKVHETDLFDRTLKRAVEMTKPHGPLGPFAVSTKLYDNLMSSGLYLHTKASAFDNIWEIYRSGTPIWDVFKKNFVPSSKIKTPEAAFGKVWFYFTNNLMGNNINKWSKLLVDLGVRAITDYGNGIIHPAEPHQAVVIDTGAAKLVMAKDNPNVATLSDDDKDSQNDAIADKYTEHAQFSKNKSLLMKIANLKNPDLDRSLSLNPNLDKKILLSLLNRKWGGFLITNLIKNPSINVDEIKSKLVQMMDTLGTQKQAQALKKSNANEVLLNSMSTSLKNDSDYRQKIIYYFSDDAGTITNLLGNIKPTTDELKKIIAGMRGSRTTTQPLSQKYALLVNCLWSGTVDPTAEWINWVWSLNDPELPRTGVIRHMLQFYYLKPSLGTPDSETMKAFSQTVYKDVPSSDEELNQEWSMFLKKFGQEEKKVAESKKHKIYFKLPRR